MAKLSLDEFIKAHRHGVERAPGEIGPYVTISRQYGCWGFSLGMLLLEILQEKTAEPWHVYGKEILERLASETEVAVDLLDKERRSKPRLVVDFLRALSRAKVPSGYEIRNRITAIIRGLAVEGNAIILGQGSAGATGDLPNGLSIRLEAPLDWRIEQVMFREGVKAPQAKKLIRTREKEREYLRRIYEIRYPRKPAFNLVYDCSMFTLAQIAQQVVYAMELKKIIHATAT